MSGTTTKFLYDGWNVIQEQGSTGTPTANLITGLGLDEVFSRTDSAGARSFLTDPLGSTVALADTSGVVQTSYTYEPFGKATQSGQTNTNPFQFTGRENDGAPGLSSYRARYLNPTYGRFVSEDPIGFSGGDVNLYAYVGNGPTYRVGAFGLFLAPGGGGGTAESTAGRKDWWSRNCGVLALGCAGDALAAIGNLLGSVASAAGRTLLSVARFVGDFLYGFGLGFISAARTLEVIVTVVSGALFLGGLIVRSPTLVWGSTALLLGGQPIVLVGAVLWGILQGARNAIRGASD